jgi:Domain of unknown function (DUF4340)
MIRPPQMLGLIAAGIACTGAGLWLVSRHVADTAMDGQGPVLPMKQDTLNSVTGLRIFKGDGSHTTLTREATRWIVAERGYPADSGQVRKLLLDVSALQAEEQKTADPALYSKLGVEDPSGVQSTSTGLTIDINNSKLTLIVGKTFGTRGAYVRVADQAQSVLATPQLAPDADPRHWLDRSLLDIAPDQVNEMDLTPQSGPDYTIKRAAPGATPEYVVSPIPKGRELGDASLPSAQAAALAGLQLDDVRKPGSVAAVAHASFHTSDGLVLAIAGIQDADQRYITVVVSTEPAAPPTALARARELNARLSGWEFQIPGYRYETLFRPLEQLLQPKSSAPAASGALRHSPAAPAGLPFGAPGHDQSQDKVAPQQSH